MNKNQFKLVLSLVLFLVLFFTLSWLDLPLLNIFKSSNSELNWTDLYQVLALIGGIVGLIVSRSWGGYNSLIGRSIMFFSIGLFLQSLGQIIFSFYDLVLHVDVPYPSIADIGFFGSVLAYIYGVILLFKASGFKIYKKNIINHVFIYLTIILFLFLSYFFLIKNHYFDWNNYLKLFLDLAYPVGQSIYVSITFMVLFFSRNILGGVMKKPVLLLLVALIFQYLSDCIFLYQQNLGIWEVGGINDYFYCLSYALMTLALLYFGITFNKIKNS
ncbi:hypothetical protein K8Q94_01805 [Candidatus Nomurabacteria bacterium]|nr:hypothetical protein [Candidatus Nomurabacteria bacterium]